MLQIIFGALAGAALLGGLARGQGPQVAQAMLQAGSEAVTTAVGLAGGFGFFCGMLSILRKSGAVAWMGRRLAPLLRFLLGPQLPPDALESVTLNLAANMLGLGNAATPMGLEAARRMGGGGEKASNALCMFLVINASSVQLIPATVIALRAAAGSAQPGAVAGPALLSSCISTLVGVAACKIGEKIA